MISLNFRDGRPLYEQICASVRRAISTGAMQPGDKLPSVRELATSLAINPNTIQRAYRMLESEGWILSAPGKGSFAAGVPETAALKLKSLYAALDDAVAQLVEAGEDRETIIAHIGKGAENNAESK